MDCIVHGVAKSGIQLRDFHYHLYNLFSQLHFPLLLFIIHFNLLKNFLLSAMSFLFPKSLISVYTNSKLLFTWSSQIYTLYNFLSVLHCLPFCPTLSNTFCPTILFCSFIFFLSSHLYSYVFLPQSLFPTDSLFIICIHSIIHFPNCLHLAPANRLMQKRAGIHSACLGPEHFCSEKKVPL